MILELLGQRYGSVLLDIAVIGSMLVTLWGMVKISYERVVGEPMPRKKIVLVLDILTDLVPNVLGAMHTVAKAKGERVFLPEPGTTAQSLLVPPPQKTPPEDQ